MSAYWLDLKWPLFIGVWAFSDTWIRAANAEARVALLEARLAEVDGQLSTEEKRLYAIQRRLIDARGPNGSQTPLEVDVYASLTRNSRLRMAIAGMTPPVPIGAPADVVSNDEPRTDDLDRPPETK